NGLAAGRCDEANVSVVRPAPRRGTPRPPVQHIDALAGLPACGAGFSPPIPAFPTPRGQWLIEDLSGHGRGGGCFGVQVLEPYRIPSSPVVGQEPTLGPPFEIGRASVG